MIYLAGPYTAKLDDGSPDISTMRTRFEILTEMAGRLMDMGHIVYSPITHGHVVAERVDLPHDWDFWERNAVAFLDRCDVMFVATLVGWRESVGVRAEVDYCARKGIHVRYITHCLGMEAHWHDRYNPWKTEPDLFEPVDLRAA